MEKTRLLSWLAGVRLSIEEQDTNKHRDRREVERCSGG